MRYRKLDLALVLSAAALFGWGILRALNRGDPAASSWTTYVMLGSVILAAANSFILSRMIATLVIVISALFSILVIAAAILAASEGIPADLVAVIRALGFFLLLAIASWIQRSSVRAAG